MSSIIDTDKLLVKYKTAGQPDHIIAAKLGIPVDEVKKRWAELETLAKEMDCGYIALSTQYNILCQQYQLLGESLKIIANALGNRMTIAEVNQILCSAGPGEAATKVISSAIVLRPFKGIDPIESLKESTQKIQQGN